MKPLISVCVLTYNHENFIEKSLKGIFSQSIINQCEIIIGDDCSQDSTVKLMEACLVSCPCEFTLISRTKNIGPGENYFDVISKARGTYVAYLDGDDCWIEDQKLEKQIDIFTSRDEIGLVGALPRIFPSQNKAVINNGHELWFLTKENLLYKNKITNSSVVFKLKAFQSACRELDAKFPEWEVLYLPQDYAIWLMIASKFVVINMKFECVDVNVQQGTLSRPKDQKKIINYLKSVLKMKIKFLDYYNVSWFSINRWKILTRILLIIFVRRLRHLMNKI